MMTVKAVFGIEVSMDCDAVKLVSFSTKGHKHSNDMRTASGLRLFPGRRLVTFGHISSGGQNSNVDSPFQCLALYLSMLILKGLE
jgi:hypothetical protein